MNMVMIIVDPLGNPIIIPGGRMLATGDSLHGFHIPDSEINNFYHLANH